MRTSKVVPECKEVVRTLCIWRGTELISFLQPRCGTRLLGFSLVTSDPRSVCPTDGEQEVG